MTPERRKKIIQDRIDVLEEQVLVHELDYQMLSAAGKSDEAQEALERLEEHRKGLEAIKAFKANAATKRPVERG